MTREEIIREIALLPEQLKNAERNFQKAQQYLYEAKHELFLKECDLINDGKVKGKNDQQRQAEMIVFTRELHAAVFKASVVLDQMKLEYDYLKRKFEVAELMARLMITPRV